MNKGKFLRVWIILNKRYICKQKYTCYGKGMAELLIYFSMLKCYWENVIRGQDKLITKDFNYIIY